MTQEITEAEAWLKEGIKLFSRQGNCDFSVEELSSRLGYEASSFYDHFNHVEDFLQAMFLYWRKTKTTQIVEKLNREPVEKRLEKLVDLVFSDRSQNDFLFYFRKKAAKEKALADLLEEVEQERINSTRYIFSGLGFGLKEIDLKVEILYSFYLGWYERYKGQPFTPGLRQEVLEQLHHLLGLED